MSDLTRLNPAPHAIAVYASSSLSPVITQHSLPSGRCPLLAPDFHRLDRTSLPGALTRSPCRRGQQRGEIVRPSAIRGWNEKLTYRARGRRGASVTIAGFEDRFGPAMRAACSPLLTVNEVAEPS